MVNLRTGARFRLYEAEGVCGEIFVVLTARDLEKRFPLDINVQLRQIPTLRALLALSQKNPEKAIEIFQITTPVEFGSIPAPVYVRGGAFLALGQGREAAAEFQKILNHVAS